MSVLTRPGRFRRRDRAAATRADAALGVAPAPAVEGRCTRRDASATMRASGGLVEPPATL